MLHEISQGAYGEKKLINQRHIISIALFVMAVVRFGKWIIAASAEAPVR